MPTLRIPSTYDAYCSNAPTKSVLQTILKVGHDDVAGVLTYRAAAYFDISTLPASADVTRVELETMVRTPGGAANRWNIAAYNATGQDDPSTDAAATFFTRCLPATGIFIKSSTDESGGPNSLFRCSGRHRFVLGLGAAATACTLVEAAKAATKPFTIGFSEGFSEGASTVVHCELEATYYDAHGPPELIVTYNETTLIGTLLAALAQRIDRTRYLSSTLTTSSATVPADTSTLHRAGYWDDHWMLPGAGDRIGQSRQVNTWTPSVYTLAKAFTGATGTVAYEMYPFPPDLATRAINEAITELFPAFVYLPYEYECLVANERQQYYDMPSGMGWVGEVDWRATVTTPDWYPVAFERVDDTRIRVAGALPTEAKVLRLRGRQQLTKFDYADPLTLTEVTEVLYPETWDAPVVELLLAYAEWKLHKWVFVDWDKPPAPGTLPPATYRKIDFLEKEITRLKRAVGRRGRRMSEVRNI